MRRFGPERTLALLQRRATASTSASAPASPHAGRTGRPRIDDSAVIERLEFHLREDSDLANRSTMTFRQLRMAIAEAARRTFKDLPESQRRKSDFIQGKLKPEAVQRLTDNLHFTFDGDFLHGFDYSRFDPRGETEKSRAYRRSKRRSKTSTG
jgi:hypothetical protein